MKPFRYDRGLSLVEMLIVTLIIGILSAITLSVLVTARKGAEKAVVSNQLKQVSLAVGLYMSNNDDIPPASLGALKRASGLPLATFRSPKSGLDFYYTHSFMQVARNGRGVNAPGFEPSQNSIVKDLHWTDFNCGPDNRNCLVRTWVDKSGKGWAYTVPTLRQGQSYRVLGARLDGSVGWFQQLEDWERSLVEPATDK